MFGTKLSVNNTTGIHHGILGLQNTGKNHLILKYLIDV